MICRTKHSSPRLNRIHIRQNTRITTKINIITITCKLHTITNHTANTTNTIPITINKRTIIPKHRRIHKTTRRLIKMLNQNIMTIPCTLRILLIIRSWIPIIHINRRILRTTQKRHIHPNNQLTSNTIKKLNLMIKLCWIC